MGCKRCSSESGRTFRVEMNFHFPGLEGLDKPGVLVFPEVLVCLDCGFAEFAVSKGELVRLAEDAATSHVDPA